MSVNIPSGQPTQSTQNQSLDQNITNTCNLVMSMMNADGVVQQTRTAIMGLVTLTLNSDTYIDSVRQQINTIISGGNFNQNDIPAVLTIILQSKSFLQSALSTGATTATSLDMSTMKYVIYAVIHFVMVAENVNPAIVTSLDTTFSALWNLVAINPQELVSDVSTITHKCFPCLFKK